MFYINVFIIFFLQVTELGMNRDNYHYILGGMVSFSIVCLMVSNAIFNNI